MLPLPQNDAGDHLISLSVRRVRNRLGDVRIVAGTEESIKGKKESC